MNNTEEDGRPAPLHQETGWMTVTDWPGGTLETFDELSSAHHDHDHHGLRARYCSQQSDVLRIVAMWKSEAAAERFFAQLPDANRARLAPGSAGEPRINGFAIQRVYDATTEAG